ncbi:transposase [Streptacidiphilus sp. PB12-B1b]|nr:transposase [Streptacidiphilus sp. PB12-B1b]
MAGGAPQAAADAAAAEQAGADRAAARRRRKARAKAAGLGRSRGGLSCKIHAAVDSAGLPLAFVLTPGQAADCPQFRTVLEKIRVPGPVGRPRTRPDAVAADKTPHAVIGSSRCGEGVFRAEGEGCAFIVGLTGGQAVVELTDHAVEQVPKGRVVAVSGFSSSVVVGMGAG